MWFLALLFSVLFNGLVFSWLFTNPVPQTPGGSFVSVSVSVVIVCEMLLRGVVSSVLEWSLLRFAGNISFSMYLLHIFVIYSGWVRRQAYWDQFWAVWGLTFLLSPVSYQLIEWPCQWLAGRVCKIIKARDTKDKLHRRAALPIVSPTNAINA